MTSKRPWTGYEITSKELQKTLTEKWGTLSKLRHIYHTAHQTDARRILQDREMRANLVTDKSVMADERLPVVWTSPNTWGLGSMYGTVIFSLPWPLFEPLHLYWVEAMESYRPSALRIVVSRSDDLAQRFDNKLTPIDPTRFGAPLYFDGKAWYWKHDFNYELMIDENISLKECSELWFETHNKTLCNKSQTGRKNAAYCSEKDQGQTIRQFVSLALSAKDDTLAQLLYAEQPDSCDDCCTDHYERHLIQWLLADMEANDLKKGKNFIREIPFFDLVLAALGNGLESEAKEALMDSGRISAFASYVGDKIANRLDAKFPKLELSDRFKWLASESIKRKLNTRNQSV